jgi:hypothetical protein
LGRSPLPSRNGCARQLSFRLVLLYTRRGARDPLAVSQWIAFRSGPDVQQWASSGDPTGSPEKATPWVRGRRPDRGDQTWIAAFTLSDVNGTERKRVPMAS